VFRIHVLNLGLANEGTNESLHHGTNNLLNYFLTMLSLKPSYFSLFREAHKLSDWEFFCKALW
jgi:hypothetical protein